MSADHTSANHTLTKRVVKGGVWFFAFRVATKALGIASLVIVARILKPSDFGLLGLSLLTMSIVTALTVIL